MIKGENGFIKLHRQFKEWEWYTDIPTKTLFIHLLLSVSYQDYKYRGMIIKAGQRICSQRMLAEETGLSEMQVRRGLRILKKTKEISLNATNYNTLVTVENWAVYQDEGKEDNEPITNQQRTNNEPITNEERTNNEASNKNTKNTKNTKNNPPIVPPKGGEAEGVKAGTAKATSKAIASWDEIETLLVGFDDEFKDCYKDYMIMRKSIRKPLTMRAAKIGLGKLKRFSKGDTKVAIQIMEQSILNSWQDFYELERKGARKQTEEVNFTDFL